MAYPLPYGENLGETEVVIIILINIIILLINSSSSSTSSTPSSSTQDLHHYHPHYQPPKKLARGWWYVYLYFLVTPHEAPDHSQSYIQKGGISGDQAPLHQLILIFAPKNAGNVATITQVYIVSGTFTVILCLAMLPSSLISLLKSPFVHHNNIVIRIILRRRCCFYVIVVVIVIITVNFILIIIFLTA